MSETDNDNNERGLRPDKSRKRRKSSGKGWLFLLIPLILLLLAALFFACRYGIRLYQEKNPVQTEASVSSEAAGSDLAEKTEAAAGSLPDGTAAEDDTDVCMGDNCENTSSGG